jgi:hypothetical protein
MGTCFSKSNIDSSIVDSTVDEVEITNYKVHFPKHEPRKSSTIYTRTHKHMKHMPCFICQKTNHYY